MRLIDADVLLNELGDIWNIPKDWDGDIDETCETAFDVIENQPTVEAIPKEKLDEIVERLEEERTLLRGERKEAIEYDDEQIIFATNNQIRAFDYSIRVVKEVGGMND